jgi:threonine synthase
LRSLQLANSLGLTSLFFKNEGQNPTGSFKDRGMTVAVTRAREKGAKVLLCASTGNTSASLAAYAARAKLTSAVIVPSGKVAAGKLAQAVAYGSRIFRVQGGFDDALRLAMKAVSQSSGLYLMNSVNPYRLEGQKTVAYEIYEQLGHAVPDYVVLPVGNAGNISAVWKGFDELRKWRMTTKVPKMIGVQSAGAAPIADAFSRGLESVQPWPNPETEATAIRIGNPVSWRKALNAIRASGGLSLAVSDAEILTARRELAVSEGIFVEAASAAPVAALSHIAGKLEKDSTIVCIATGNGLKDQESIDVNLNEATVVKDSGSLLRILVD